VLRAPLRELEERKRRMYVTSEISLLLDGARAGSHFANGAADAQITDFIDGWSVNVSREQREWKKWEKPHLVRLVGCDEVWEMCFRKPVPGWRLFGRFLERAVFVGLVLKDKRLLGTDYSGPVAEVLAEWARLFPGVDPVRATDLDDYLGFQWRDVDEEN
jgi:hypothetical protein